ncbi:hypothetical protein [Candidatus Uabimicrobium sp. HlEnr_7]|uniref:hypothetical protein n=1 Tax=Candidatus Uabimicrobium helgolandensis TaxID=3095367 RepID=UPI00355724ED
MSEEYSEEMHCMFKEAAEYLEISLEDLQKLVAEGEIRAFYNGNVYHCVDPSTVVIEKVMFRRSDVRYVSEAGETWPYTIYSKRPKRYSAKRGQKQTVAAHAAYSGCTFYLDENRYYDVQNTSFNNCSFRGNVKFRGLYCCEFYNCGFNGKVSLYAVQHYRHFAHEEQSYIPIDYVYNLSFIDVLEIEACVEEELQMDGIEKLQKLSVLRIKGGNIRVMPSNIGELQKLSVLDFSNNHLFELGPEIGKCHNLSVLDLSNNYLEDLPVELHQLSKLSLLNLIGNPIKKIPNKVANMKGLSILHEKPF